MLFEKFVKINYDFCKLFESFLNNKNFLRFILCFNFPFAVIEILFLQEYDVYNNLQNCYKNSVE